MCLAWRQAIHCPSLQMVIELADVAVCMKSDQLEKKKNNKFFACRFNLHLFPSDITPTAVAASSVFQFKIGYVLECTTTHKST